MTMSNATRGPRLWAAGLLVPVALVFVARAGGSDAAVNSRTDAPTAPNAAGPMALDAASAAQAFIATLGEDARAKALYALGDEERFDWHFVPAPETVSRWPR